MPTTPARPSVFVSYSHQDEAWKDRLVKQLRVLELEGDLEVWDDRQIAAGDDWLPAIEAAMARARAAVLLISADFLTSGFIRSQEVPELLRRREEEGLRVIPVIVHPCAWTAVSWLSPIQCKPKDGKALASFAKAKAEKHLSDLALELRVLLTPSGRVAAPSPALRGRDGEGELARHNLPYPRLGDLFTGRQDELDALAGGGTAAITQSTALSGLGGIGKTRLAVEYAWRSGNRYTAAWFVRADSPENLRRNLAALAGPELLNLPEWEEQNEARTVAAVKRSLRDHPGWLMILDNVDTPEAAGAVLEMLPSLSQGRVLITSRLGSWPPDVQKQALEKLSQEEAVRFLLHRTEGGRELAADDAAVAGELAQRVDGLPLALEQAAAYIVRHRMRLANYLQAWEAERAQVLRWFDPQVMRYPASVAVTWQNTFQQLTPTPAALLRLTAFLAPDPIPVEIFEQGSEHVGAAAGLYCEESGKAPDGKAIREAVADLAGFSMVSQEDGRTFAVHRMVQEALQQQIPEGLRKAWIERTVEIANEVFANPQDFRTWQLLDRFRAHAAQIVAWADQARIAEPVYQLMNQLGVHFVSRGLYSQAEPLLRHALARGEATLGPEAPDVAVHLNNLARVLRDTGRAEEAEQLQRRALSIGEASLGIEDSTFAVYLNNLALLLMDTDRLAEAEPLVRRALAITEATLGQQHSNVATALNNLAWLLQNTNRPDEAEPLLRRALAIDEANFGKTSPDVASDLNNLAQLLKATNRLEEAELLMLRALDIWEKSLDKDHPDIQKGRENLALLLETIASEKATKGS